MHIIKSSINHAAYTILLFIVCSAVKVLAQMPVRMGPAPAAEINKAFVAVQADLNSFDAHKKYIYAKGMGNPALLAQYEVWMKKYPDNVNIPLAAGTVFHNAEMPQAKDFLVKAAAMDTTNAKVWSMLSADADRWGQDDLAVEYSRKAVLADPSNVSYAYRYVTFFENGDPDTYKKKVFDFVKRFPEDQLGAQALYWLSIRTVNLNDRVHYLEVLRELYPPQKFNWSASGMTGLADAYVQTDPDKALMLISEIGWEGDWTIRKEVAESLIEINKLEQDQNYSAASIKLNQVKLPRFNYINDFIALKKASLQEQIGDGKGAYDSLSVKFAKLPSDALYGAIESYGKKLGRDKEQVVQDIDSIRSSTSTAAYPFELGLYTSSGKLNLNSLRGKVILLTFWFPGCSPCREEFPHFQTVVNSFKGDSLVYLGINVTPSQDGYVLPFIKNTKYSFIPLRGSSSFAEKKYGVTGEPKNFLIDKDGKIIFKDFRIDNTNRRTLELMISSLLKKEPAKQ